MSDTDSEALPADQTELSADDQDAPAADMAGAATEAAVEPSVREIDGRVYWLNAKGALWPLELIEAADQLEDEFVRRLTARAEELSAAIAKFRDDTFDDVAAFNLLLDEKYGVKRPGTKGNQTFNSYDDRLRISVQVADLFEFGSRLQQAKALVDECLTEWAADSRAELRVMVDYAFQVDKTGKINRGRLLGLRRLAITDPRWVRAMQAIADSMKVTGTKPYVRFHKRATARSGWRHIPLDSASA